MEIQESVQSNGPLIPQPHGGALQRWAKGQSANPGGKPKGWRAVSTAWTDIQALDLDPTKKPTRKRLLDALLKKNGRLTPSDELAVSQYLLSLKGWASKHKDEKGLPIKVVPPSVEAANLILNRTEGLLATADVSGQGGIVVVNLGVGFGLPSAAKTQVIGTQALISDSEGVTSDNTHYVKILEPAQVVDSEWDGLGLG